MLDFVLWTFAVSLTPTAVGLTWKLLTFNPRRATIAPHAPGPIQKCNHTHPGLARVSRHPETVLRGPWRGTA